MTGTDIAIRDISGQREMQAVEKLQTEVWGGPDLDVVPLSQLVAAKAAGGVLIGAFDRDSLVGFAYGFVGYEDGHLTHHSHMLAVRPAYRSFNIGYRLKLAQRERVLEQGIERMTWTFDPLQSMNAYFNFNKLGVVSDKYFVNFYGEDAASFLHRNGTDRLWVTWLLNSRRVSDRLQGEGPSAEINDISPLVEVGNDDTPLRNSSNARLLIDQAAIEIPTEIAELERRDMNIAVEWREATRWAFTEAINNGFVVDGFYRAERKGRISGTYHLRRAGSLSDLEGPGN